MFISTLATYIHVLVLHIFSLAIKQVWDYTPDIDLSLNKPISIVLTQFHFLLLLHDRVKAICTLNGQVVYEDVFPDKFGALKKMIKDPVGGLVWIYTERAVFRYHIQRESRDVWQMYMSMSKFDLAKEYCRDRPECMDMVLAKEAEHCFQNKRYLESAKCYALTQNYFEEIALKFIEAKQEEALKEFLLKKLNNLKASERTQITLLVTWLAELYLNRLGQLESDGNAVAFKETRDEFHQFLCNGKHKDCLFNNRSTIYDLLASHGNVDDMVYFSVVMQDYERVISHYCQHDDYGAALDVLSKHCDQKLFYKFSPVLMQHIPKKVVDAWIQMGKRLDPKKLIPALMNYSQMGSTQQISETIRYMEFCVYELTVTEEAIHNYLLSLYAKYKPDSLLWYLEQAGTRASEIHYDLKYALRLCAENGYLRACVLVYRIMELYEEAVDLALQVSARHVDGHEADAEQCLNHRGRNRFDKCSQLAMRLLSIGRCGLGQVMRGPARRRRGAEEKALAEDRPARGAGGERCEESHELSVQLQPAQDRRHPALLPRLCHHRPF